ncbi:MAG TPA: pyruvate dehydrogenase (acetyl-transferring) E1 component subunit alpha [Ktedonobacteraceae bacterium]|nr:pyruvate dehydrogenase (acetyl-transferring) E1 component subunit alpha [Ktedonobacteraceae bacterium]
MDTKSKQQSDAGSASSVRDQSPPAIPKGEDRDTLLNYYHQMVLIRHFEEKAGEMYTKARIGGYCHLNLGEEATVVGFCAGLEPTDYVYTNYREHGYAIGRGVSPEAVMAELFGKETGCSHGRGGSMHLFDLERRFMGGYAIVGGQLPLATGAAFAVSYRGSHEVVACQMGDGTTNTGAFHESLNFAKIYSLPIIYFVVNNQYGMGLRVDQGSAVGELYRKACAYDMRSERVDGNDVLAVRDAVRNAAKIAREQHQPSLIEAISYRFAGHSVVDPDRYREKEEVQKAREQDPITAFASRLISAGLLDEQKAQEIDEQAQQEVDAAVKFADESTYPSVEAFMQGLEEYVYALDDASMKGA